MGPLSPMDLPFAGGIRRQQLLQGQGFRRAGEGRAGLGTQQPRGHPGPASHRDGPASQLRGTFSVPCWSVGPKISTLLWTFEDSLLTK